MPSPGDRVPASRNTNQPTPTARTATTARPSAVRTHERPGAEALARSRRSSMARMHRRRRGRCSRPSARRSRCRRRRRHRARARDRRASAGGTLAPPRARRACPGRARDAASHRTAPRRVTGSAPRVPVRPSTALPPSSAPWPRRAARRAAVPPDRGARSASSRRHPRRGGRRGPSPSCSWRRASATSTRSASEAWAAGSRGSIAGRRSTRNGDGHGEGHHRQHPHQEVHRPRPTASAGWPRRSDRRSRCGSRRRSGPAGSARRCRRGSRLRRRRVGLGHGLTRAGRALDRAGRRRRPGPRRSEPTGCRRRRPTRQPTTTTASSAHGSQRRTGEPGHRHDADGGRARLEAASVIGQASARPRPCRRRRR